MLYQSNSLEEVQRGEEYMDESIKLVGNLVNDLISWM